MSKITILITAYKDRGWIDEAIQSAKDQLFDDYDILFASDGNKDLRKYADKHKLPFFLSPKANYSVLVNRAMEQIESEWVKILHDDDLLTANCLSDLYSCRGKADMVYGDAFIFHGDDKENYTYYKPPEVINFSNLMPIITNPVNFEAELIKRKTFLDIGGFDPALGYTEDYDYLLNLLENDYQIKYCDSAVVWYRHHDRQITGNEPGMRKGEQNYLISKHMNHIVSRIHWDE